MQLLLVMISLFGLTSTQRSDLYDTPPGEPLGMSDDPPINPNEFMNPVIFEPQPKIRLTRSTYKITTFLDFAPFINGFNNVQTYLKKFSADVHDPEYTNKLTSAYKPSVSILYNDSMFESYFQSARCRASPYRCANDIKIDRVKEELGYIQRIFNATYQKFLSAIDHIDYHPTMTERDEENLDNENVRAKRSTTFKEKGTYHPFRRTLTPEEDEFLDKLLGAILEINPKLHAQLNREKRFGLVSWILGWGVYSNSRSIKKIKKNLRILEKQNLLQDHQIKILAKHLNLTMTQVNRHEEMLYELDTKLMILNKTIQDIMIGISFMRFEMDLLDHIQLRLNRLHSALFALKNDIDSLYDYMRVLASQQLNPLIIPPDILRTILQQVEEDIKTNARLILCEDPLTNIWAYYNIIKITPIVMDDYLMIILTIPLIDRTLDVNLYKVHNLPMTHPSLGLHANLKIEGQYFASLMDGMYITLPDPENIKLCMMSQGHLCMFDQALYPVDRTNWCIYALFINDINRIQRDCMVDTTARTTHLAHSLDGYLWAISSLAAEKLQIRCVLNTTVVTIKPPLTIIDVGNGCEAFSSNIYIPAKSELTATYQSVLRSQFFLEYNFNYTDLSKYLIWYQFSYATLTLEEQRKLRKKIIKLDPLPMGEFQQELQRIDDDYGLTIPSSAILSFQIIAGLSLLGMGSALVYFLIRHKSHIQSLLKFAPKAASWAEALLPISDPSSCVTTSPPSQKSAKTDVPPLPARRSTPVQPSGSKLTTSPADAAKPSATPSIPVKYLQKAATELQDQGLLQLKSYNKYAAKQTSPV